MTSRHGQFTIAVLVFSAVVLLSFAEAARAQCASKLAVTLANDGKGNCTQQTASTGDQRGNYVLVNTDTNHCVTWMTASSIPIDVQFSSGASPFARFTTTDGKGSPVTSGPATGEVGVTYHYTSLIIGDPKQDGSHCKNESSLGIVMR